MTNTAASSTMPEGPHAELSQSYQYASVVDKPRTIRLLKIQHTCCVERYNWHGQNLAERGRCKEPCCEWFDMESPMVDLHEASLDESPEYEAVSYTWGSAALVKGVLCGCGVLQLTQNCYDLLCRLRKRSSSRCSRETGACNVLDDLYWINALCIDQGFQQERSHQVAMMATIYKKAARVIVWPGHLGRWVRSEISLNSSLKLVFKQDVPHLRTLIQQPYFTRVWPLQEIVFAQSCRILVDTYSEVDIRSVLLMSHPNGYHRDVVSESLELISLRKEYERVTTLHRRLLESFQSDSDISSASSRPSIPPTSENLLYARSHQASEPRDKVFALYGVLQHLHVYLKSPDYLKAVEDVYLEASAAVIRKDCSLRVFEGLTGVSNFSLPSWCPDWSDHQHITKVAEWTDHKASGSSKAQPSFQGWELLAYGQLIDVVRREHIAFAATSFLVEASTLSKSLAEVLPSPSHVPSKQYLDFLENLFLNVWGNEKVKIPRDCVHLKWVQNDAEQKTEKPTICRLIGYQGNKEITEGFLQRSTILHAGLCRVLDRKKLFQTQHGRLGIASQSIKSGDSIILLQGCNLPMVARPEGTKWKIIAPAYLPADGIMEGNLWKPEDALESFLFI